MLKKFLAIGDNYAAESGWEDFALVKLCLFSMGLVAGIFLPEKYKKPAICAALAAFISTYIPLMKKLFRIAFTKKD
jgi:hypothetical protein